MIVNQPKITSLSLPRGNTLPPGDIYNDLAAWFNSQNVVKGSNNLVSQMTDLSGRNYHAVQATSSLQPRWVDDFCNGYPVVRFRGEAATSCYLATASITGNSYVYIFLAARMLEYMGGGTLVAACTSYLSAQYSGTTVNWFISNIDSGVPLTFTSGPVVVEMAAAGSQSFISANTVRGRYVSYTPSSAIATIGCRSLTLNTGCAMDLAELLIYNNHMDEVQQFRVRNYLGFKYGADVV